MTTIDGDEITGVTIDGDEVQEITVDGDLVWKRLTFVDDFSHQNPSQYYSSSNDSTPSSFTTTSSWGDQSTNSLEPTNLNGSANRMRSFDPNSSWNDSNQPNDLNYYPGPGDVIHVRFQMPHSHDGSYQGTDTDIQFWWGCSGITDEYELQISAGNIGPPAYLRDQDGSSVDSFDVGSFSNGHVFEWVIDWSSGSISATLHDISDGGTRGTVSGSVSSHSGRGVGFRCYESENPPARFDAVWVE